MSGNPGLPGSGTATGIAELALCQFAVGACGKTTIKRLRSAA